jgi:dienelactone hydrolase
MNGEERDVHVSIGNVTLEGSLGLPDQPKGVVLFAHGSGSSRFSPRNRFVARLLRDAGLGTLLIDLLTAHEEEIDLVTRHMRFDIRLLAERLVGAVDWLSREERTAHLSTGLFGSSTGAAAALVAAAARPQLVGAVVSRGGRPDLAGDALSQVAAPTLLLVGSRDEPVIELNREAMARMHAPADLQIIEGATHLFEEPGTLDQVARQAATFFADRLAAAQQPAAV